MSGTVSFLTNWRNLLEKASMLGNVRVSFISRLVDYNNRPDLDSELVVCYGWAWRRGEA